MAAQRGKKPSIMWTQEDVRSHLKRFFSKHGSEWLLARGRPEPPESWPITVPLRPPTENEAAGDTEAVRRWLAPWRELPKRLVTVAFVERRFRFLGAQRLPSTLEIPDPETAMRWVSLERGSWAEAL